MSQADTLALCVNANPRFARLVRMSASNAALLSSMSVERVEDVRMAAEEAFIYACAATPDQPLSISFAVDETQLSMVFELDCESFPTSDPQDPSCAYVDLILSAVCDAYDKQDDPASLLLTLSADL